MSNRQLDIESYINPDFELPPPPPIPPLIKRKKAKAIHNTGKEDWYTPLWIMDLVRRMWGEIDLDPMSSLDANEHVQAKVFYSKDQDGLSKSWFGHVWLNPPYNQYVMKAVLDKLDSVLLGDPKEQPVKSILMITNNSTETSWGQRALRCANAVCFLAKRVRFIDGKTLKLQESPLQGQMILLFVPKHRDEESVKREVERFRDVFDAVGICK